MGWTLSIALLVANLGALASLSGGFGAASTADAAGRAAVLARSISEGLNLFAFGIIACILPAAATVMLFVRQGRLKRAAP